ncbi:MAG: enoyl-CoA hydratase/isomerase family protein [Deltaproteobacteria bacterium]|nr:enoyl-CoA hydratase/isomerase family protein [Deltaproteobacteria bacterium]
MEFVRVTREEGVATVVLSRGKVNALNEQLVDELKECFGALEDDDTVRAAILTGSGPFFSFGFDIPELFDRSREEFTRFLRKFTGLYAGLFVYPKPLIGALNGHAVAGGCMLALTCDYRIVVAEKAKVSLNEIAIGSTVPAGSAHMLRFCTGDKNAQTILYSGALYSAVEAYERGLVEQVCAGADLEKEARLAAERLAEKEPAAFRSIKRHLRAPFAEEMAKREEASIEEFVDVWCSEPTRKRLREVKIR